MWAKTGDVSGHSILRNASRHSCPAPRWHGTSTMAQWPMILQPHLQPMVRLKPASSTKMRIPSFKWDFVIVSITVPIIAADFLCANGLLVDVANHHLIDAVSHAFHYTMSDRGR